MSIAIRLYRPLWLALAATSLVATPALADPAVISATLAATGFDQQAPRDQDRAFRNTREGRSMPLPMIEKRVRPHMGGADYLGPELKGETYRLKFMQDGHVIWVDVDAATGRIVRRSSGN
jgi:uncharacterized membrane protein YkoI